MQAPTFEVDPLWPRPLPNHWVLGQTIGVAVDAQDHIWIVHRGDASLNIMTEGNNTQGPDLDDDERSAVALVAGQPAAAAPGPARWSFSITGAAPAQPATGHLTVNGHRIDDAEGIAGGVLQGRPARPRVRSATAISSATGAVRAPGFDWPGANHGITVDYKGNVWIGGNDPGDAQVLKFTRRGSSCCRWAIPGKNAGSHDMENFWRAAKVFVDPKMNEAYVADGYGNKRVVVIDADTGKFKRYWGAYGNKPDDTNLGPYDPDAPPARQFRSPVHCAEVSNDGLVYVCDRANNRIQVFQRDGTFVKEIFIARRTRAGRRRVGHRVLAGSRAEVPVRRRWTQRKGLHRPARTMDILTSFGDGGRQPGQFFGVHSIATDSRGNVYTAETYEGKRLQKFVLQGHGTGDDAGPGHAVAEMTEGPVPAYEVGLAPRYDRCDRCEGEGQEPTGARHLL